MVGSLGLSEPSEAKLPSEINTRSSRIAKALETNQDVEGLPGICSESRSEVHSRHRCSARTFQNPRTEASQGLFVSVHIKLSDFSEPFSYAAF